MHEGNVCVKQGREPSLHDPKRHQHKFGYSGLETTIIDFTLSHAVYENQRFYKDMEPDKKTMFDSSATLQRQIYRR